MAPTRNPRWLFLLIVIITAGPFGLAWYMARHPEYLNASHSYGDLIIPPRPSQWSDVAIVPNLGELPAQELRDHWVLLQFAPQGRCDAACQTALQTQHQVWLRLSKDLARVRRLLLIDAVPAALEADGLAALKRADPTLLIGQVQGELNQTLNQTALPAGLANTLWLVDPLGNVMARYPLNFEPHNLLRDLQRLLKISQIG